MLVCFFNLLPNGKFAYLLIVTAFSGKTSFSVKNSYLQTFIDEKAKTLAAHLSNHIEVSFA